MVQARTISGVTQIEIHPEEHTTKIAVRTESETSSVGVGTNIRHDTLVGRNIANQHSIDSITGLRETLNDIQGKETFVFEQGVASDTWEINHNLNKYPSVTLVDSANTQFVAQVVYTDKNNCVVYMNGATKGKAYLN